MSNNLTKEQEIVILLSRVTFCEEVKERINSIVSQQLNWFEVYKYGLYHKTLALCISNLKKLVSKQLIMPKILQSTYMFILEGNKHVVGIYEKEIQILRNELEKRGGICIPVKGGSLTKSIYIDQGTRYMGDADFLIKYEDINILDDVLKEMGFFQGKYDKKSGTITPISRAESIKWKMYMSHLPKYQKIVDSPYVSNRIEFDFRFALDDTLNKEPVNEIVDFFRMHHFFAPSHELMHLCTHFYDEATHGDTIRAAKDLNLIKLCDIREFILRNKVEQVLDGTLTFSIKHRLEKQFYYNDGYEASYIQQLNIDDISFLNTFKSDAINDQNQFKKNFWERFFSCGNEDELMKGQGDN